ncbi:hypothetical protein B7463_g12152, partial [Scytalidium lignicola]
MTDHNTKPLIARPRNAYNLAVALFVAVGSLSYGYCTSISSAIIGQPSWYTYMDLETTGSHINSILGLLNGLYAAGGALGCIFNMWSSQYFGRKRSIQIGCAISIVGSTLMTASQNIEMLLAARHINGWGIGILVTLVPLYQSEVSPPDSRGLMVGIHGTLIGLSYAMSGFITYACYFAPTGNFQWRFPLAVQLLPITVLFIGSFWLPYSPRWLLSQQRDDEAWEVTRRLHISKDDPNDSFAHAEFRQMKMQIDRERERDAISPLGQARLAFSRRSLVRRLALGFMVQFGNQATGTLCISNYFVNFFTGLGIESPTSLLLLGLWLLSTVPGNMVNGLFIDKVGRRTFILIGLVGLVVCLVGETVITAVFVDTGSTNKVGLGFGVFFIFLYVMFYAVCLDATQYLIPSEIFPMEVRSFGMSFSVMGQWLSAMIWLLAAPYGFADIKWKFWTLFISCCCTYFILVFLYLPETKGMTLEDMGVVFGDEVEVNFETALNLELEENDKGGSNVEQVEEVEASLREKQV